MTQRRHEYDWRNRALQHSINKPDSISKRIADLLEHQPVWMAQAYCKLPKLRGAFDLPPKIRGEQKRIQVEKAKGICTRCPVLTECEIWAEAMQQKALASKNEAERWVWTDIVVAGKYYPGKNLKDIGETND